MKTHKRNKLWVGKLYQVTDYKNDISGFQDITLSLNIKQRSHMSHGIHVPSNWVVLPIGSIIMYMGVSTYPNGYSLPTALSSLGFGNFSWVWDQKNLEKKLKRISVLPGQN